MSIDEVLQPWAAVELNKRHCMNGLDLLADVKDGAIATAFFDPQYRGVLDKLAYGNEGARQKRRVELQQMDEDTIVAFIGEIARVLRPTGHLFLWIDKFHLCEGIQPWFKGTDLHQVDLITWHKGTFGMGHRSRRVCEYLMVLQKAPKRARGIWTVHDLPDVWAEKADAKSHPHAKPTRLQQILIEATTRPGDVVLDPAAGSFSVLDAARAAQRGFIGADLTGQYSRPQP